jgi:hypothetical protein
MKLYINGIAEEELLDSVGGNIDGGWSGDIATPADQLQLKYGSESYTGAMDEIIIFNRALSDEEIAKLAEGWEAGLSVSSQGKLSTTWGSIKCPQR